MFGGLAFAFAEPDVDPGKSSKAAGITARQEDPEGEFCGSRDVLRTGMEVDCTSLPPLMRRWILTWVTPYIAFGTGMILYLPGPKAQHHET